MFHYFFFLAENKIMFSCVSIIGCELVIFRILLRFMYGVGKIHFESFPWLWFFSYL